MPFVRELDGRALEEDISLLCIEKTADECHRKLLAEECQRFESSLKIIHL